MDDGFISEEEVEDHKQAAAPKSPNDSLWVDPCLPFTSTPKNNNKEHQARTPTETKSSPHHLLEEGFLGVEEDEDGKQAAAPTSPNVALLVNCCLPCTPTPKTSNEEHHAYASTETKSSPYQL
ncbi:hypothetical protein ACA910_014705 [Epithemia clementina (nom. ined.)]